MGLNALPANTSSNPGNQQKIELLTNGRSSSSVGTFSMVARVVRPPTTMPKTVCLKLRWLADLYRMKNCDPLLWGPLLAMLTTPRPEWTSFEFSSSLNGLPHIDSPPLPVPVGSPPWIMKFLRAKYKKESLGKAHQSYSMPAFAISTFGTC